ncbi:MAG: hypothetical protein H7336_07220 [Bacteriovorax sp.]|nr:hypothetical protein [Bacteriovorax sp.]
MKNFLALFFILSGNLYAKSCNDVQVRIIFEGKPAIAKETLCSKKTPDNMLFYVSKSCDENKCEILKRKKSELEIKDYYSNIGSPGFKICNELGGIPQIFEFSQGPNLWQSTERCLFGAKDFVEISLLTREWINFLKKK